MNKVAFEMLMERGVSQHNARDYTDALSTRLQAFQFADEDSIEAGRAARDIAATYDRIGLPESAFEWSNTALNIHDMNRTSEGGLRERAASSMYVGSILLRKAIGKVQAPSNTGLGYLTDALKDIRGAEHEADLTLDQYRINITGRASMAESLFGERKRGLKLGITAVGLAFKSESPKNPTSRQGLSFIDRLKAKTKAFERGVAALAINALASPQLNRRRRLALSLTQKAL